MDILSDYSRRLSCKEALISVAYGDRDTLEDHLRSLNGNLDISCLVSTQCRCGKQLEVIDSSSYGSGDYDLFKIADIILGGVCPCSEATYGNKQLVTISLLHYACFLGRSEIVKILIYHGADVRSKTSLSGYTTLQMTICGEMEEHCVVDIMSLLLSNGAEPSQCHATNGGSLLHMAVRRGYLSVIEFLLEHKCDIDEVDKDNRTALYLAVFNNRLDMVQILVKNNADVNKGPISDPPPLSVAVMAEEYFIAQELLSVCSIDVNKREPRFPSTGCTALHYAIYCENLPLVTLLLTHQADVNCAVWDGITPLLISIRHKNNLDIMPELIKFGADVHMCREDGNGAIHEAAYEDAIDRMDVLLQHGCHYDTRNGQGMTPLTVACYGGHESSALYLMNLNVNVNNVDNHHLNTPLHYASCQMGCTETCKRLVELGADPNARNEYSITPLWNAVYKSLRSVVRLLIERNVSLSVAEHEHDLLDEYDELRANCNDIKTPLYVAFHHNKDPYVAAMLIIAGVNLSEERWLRSTDLEVFNKSPGSASHVDLLRSYTESPVSLKRLCRDEIRRRLATRLADALPLLGLPASLRDYILIKRDLELCEAGTLDLLQYKFK